MLDTEKFFRLPSHMLTRAVRVLLVGAGGNGSQVLPGLARLHMTMLALGHPGGLDVTTVDGDTVSDSNVGRQLFYRTDIGQSKAVVLTHRVNACYGLSWRAVFGFMADTSLDEGQSFDIVIGCVDTRSSRRIIHHALWKARRGTLWLDLGNEAFTGQCILGQSPGYQEKDEWKRMPVVTEFFPDILDQSADAAAEKDTGPSCSLAAAIAKQSAFVNQMCATQALSLLSNLFRFGVAEYSAVFFDAKSGRSTPLAVDPHAWQRFGIERPSAPVPTAVAA